MVSYSHAKIESRVVNVPTVGETRAVEWGVVLIPDRQPQVLGE